MSYRVPGAVAEKTAGVERIFPAECLTLSDLISKRMKHTNNQKLAWRTGASVAVALLLCLLLCLGCGRGEEEPLYGLPGVWRLVSVVYPTDAGTEVSVDGDVHCRIFDADTTLYEFRLLTIESGLIVLPEERMRFQIESGDSGKWVYHEDGRLRPLHRVDDSTIVIQKWGVLHRWRRDGNMSEERQQQVRAIMDSYDWEGENGSPIYYVLSASEQNLKTGNRWLSVGLAAAALCVLFLLRQRRQRKRMEQELKSLQQERERCSAVALDVVRQAEEAFFASDYYVLLHRRVAAGEVLKPADWDEMEVQMRPVYPEFFRRLPSLRRLSLVEFRVCLLIKLRFSPSEMADVLCKDDSTIGKIRSRLYRKVFGEKGGSKNWDDFILSL